MCGRYWIEPDENPELAQIIAENLEALKELAK